MRKKIGLLLRSYAKTPEDVSGVVARAVRSVTHASSLIDLNGEAIFHTIMVLVPRDYDCGGAAKALKKELKLFEDCDPYIVSLEVYGHHSCEALNRGIELCEYLEYAVIASNKAIQALTIESITAMRYAFDQGAKVVGVSVEELQEVILDGRVQNTFAGWNVRALREVGGFDSEKGVEEVSPTVRLIRRYGPCIAVLDPKEKPTLDIRKSADGKARHDEVMMTKIARQQEEVDRMGVDFNFIKSGIMPGYPQSV